MLTRVEQPPKTVVTDVDLLRHGECEGGNIIRGQTDSPLTNRGWQQMRDATTACSRWSLIVTSPLQRCVRFAEQLALDGNMPLVVEPDFQELNFGEWDGRSLQQLEQVEANRLQDYFDDPVHNTPPGGEAMLDFQRRINAAWQRTISNYGGERLLMVAHGGVIKLLLISLLKMPLAMQTSLLVPFGSMTRLQLHRTDQREYACLLSHNCNNVDQFREQDG